MKKLYELLVKYYTKDKEIDITLFKILGSAGVLVCIVAGIQSLTMSVSGGIINFSAGIVSVLLLWFVEKTGKYVYGYILTVLGVFMGLFSMLFFEMGGLEGSMPYFFMFSLVFTYMMFKGKLLVFMELLEMVYYAGICVYAFKHPEAVTPFASPEDRFADQLMGLFICGVGIGLIFLAYIAQYRKQERIADEASKAKSRFMANMSHEIRTPINMMLGMNEMILRESENDTVKEYASNAKEAGDQLLFEVNQVLQYSRIEAGTENVYEDSYSFPKLIHSVQSYFEKEASKKNIEFIMKDDETIEKILVGDMRKLSQILTNLLSNAVKYTKEGSVSFEVRNLGKKNGMQDIYFAVKDTGVGIKPEELGEIFQSFKRVDSIKNRHVEGTGLGLAISGYLATILGTEIKVESEYTKGSTFSFVLSQKIADKDMGEIYANYEEFFVAPDASILVVDDNIMNLNVCKALLKRTMVQVDIALNAAECYEKCEKKDYDLVFMDLMMPEVDGTEAMKHLRLSKNYKNKPVVVLTADVTAGRREALLEEGFDGYLSKPIDWKELERSLLKYLPKELVTRTKEVTEDVVSVQQMQYFTKLLSEYDIDLSEGLRFLGNDILQYRRASLYFLNEADRGISEAGECILKQDYDKLTLILHSLKGNAKNVGASELGNLAARLEKRLRQGDREYVVTSEKLLTFEWERVRAGLKQFVKEFNPKEDKAKEQEKPSLDFGKMVEKLKDNIRECRQTPSLKLLEEMTEISEDEKTIEILKKIAGEISEIEFDEAEKLLEELSGGKSNV